MSHTRSENRAEASGCDDASGIGLKRSLWSIRIGNVVIQRFQAVTRSGDLDLRLAQVVWLWLYAQPRLRRRRHPAVLAARRAVGRADGDIAVKIGRGEEELGRRAVRQVGD